MFAKGFDGSSPYGKGYRSGAGFKKNSPPIDFSINDIVFEKRSPRHRETVDWGTNDISFSRETRPRHGSLSSGETSPSGSYSPPTQGYSIGDGSVYYNVPYSTQRQEYYSSQYSSSTQYSSRSSGQQQHYRTTEELHHQYLQQHQQLYYEQLRRDQQDASFLQVARNLEQILHIMEQRSPGTEQRSLGTEKTLPGTEPVCGSTVEQDEELNQLVENIIAE